MNYLYTLAFIKKKDRILMLNRLKNPWMGMWNGVGGKRNLDESPLECIIREVLEETNIVVSKDQVIDKGIVTWNDDFIAFSSGLHLFFIELADDYDYQTPILTREGILDWKPIEWISRLDNLGVAYNIPYFLNNVIHHKMRHQYHCIFEGNNLKDVKVTSI